MMMVRRQMRGINTTLKTGKKPNVRLFSKKSIWITRENSQDGEVVNYCEVEELYVTETGQLFNIGPVASFFYFDCE